MPPFTAELAQNLKNSNIMFLVVSLTLLMIRIFPEPSQSLLLCKISRPNV